MSQLRWKNQILASEILEAKTTWTRAKGLLGRSDLSSHQAMWIDPCNSIHTFFMRFSIDVLFVSRDLKVRAIHRNVKPGRMTWPVWSAKSTFEFKAGSLDAHNIREGDQLYVDP